MKLLSLYGVIAIALIVSCLELGEVLSKPVRNNRRHQQRGDRGDHRRGRHDHGRGRPETPQDDGPDHGSAEGEGTVAGSGEARNDSGSDGQTDTGRRRHDGHGDGMRESGNRTAGHGGRRRDRVNSHIPGLRPRDNSNRTAGHGRRGHNRLDDSPIRPHHIPGFRRPFSGPLGLKGSESDKKKMTRRKAMKYMKNYGYMGKMEDDQDWDFDAVSDEKMNKSICMMQRYMGLPETGELDEMTMMMMDKPRCGVHDVSVEPGENGTVGSPGANGTSAAGPQSFVLFGQKWDQQEITFRFLNYPSTMPRGETREALLRAFSLWSEVTPLTFREVTGPVYADFYIKFGARSHGDLFPFDGPGRVLAHAFFPKSGFGDLDGDMHFDDEEFFTYASYDGTNLFQVAAHEIGHSLGLSHSTDPTALMAPFYGGYQPTFNLPYDDLLGIQTIYGSNPNPFPYPNPRPNPPPVGEPTNPPTTTTTSTPTTTAPGNPTTPYNPGPEPTTVSVPDPDPADPCNPAMDAVTIWRTEFFAFTGDKYGRIRNYTILSPVGGSEARYFFQNFPGDIDAIYETPITYKLLMFKGPYYYVYEGLVQESGPYLITDLDPSLPSDLDAVLTWANWYKTYFFKGELVWRFDELTQRVDSGWPYRIDQVWEGVPNKVTGAWHDEKQYLTYFLSGKDYYRYDDYYGNVDPGYPRDFIQDFFGCF